MSPLPNDFSSYLISTIPDIIEVLTICFGHRTVILNDYISYYVTKLDIQCIVLEIELLAYNYLNSGHTDSSSTFYHVEVISGENTRNIPSEKGT